jgi:hypothetical protein
MRAALNDVEFSPTAFDSPASPTISDTKAGIHKPLGRQSCSTGGLPELDGSGHRERAEAEGEQPARALGGHQEPAALGTVGGEARQRQQQELRPELQCGDHAERRRNGGFGPIRLRSGAGRGRPRSPASPRESVSEILPHGARSPGPGASVRSSM